jgi:sporulation-control protein
MSFLNRLAASIGIGSAKIGVAALEPQQYRGSFANGALLLESGETEQEVKMLTVDLIEFWVSGSGRNRTYHERSHGCITAAENLPVAPGFRQEYPFRFGIPSDARCSRRHEGWKLKAEAHIPWAVDARASTPLKVLPHPEVLAVQRAARDSLGLIPLSWDGSHSAIFYNFGAPPWLQGQMDGVAFRLLIVGETLTGEMILNKQEHGLGDFLKAMVGGDKESLPLTIPRSVLLTKRGSPNPAGAYPYLKELFERLGLAVPSGTGPGRDSPVQDI